MRDVAFAKQTANDVKNLKAAGFSEKAKSFAEAIRENPFATPSAYESPVDYLAGLHSRCASLQHRFVCEVVENPMSAMARTSKER